MREVRNLLIGFELGDEMSQMAYYDRSSREAVSLPAKVGTNVYRFPTVLAKSREKEEWHYGLEAEYFAREGTAAPVKHLVRRAEKRESAEINGQRYEAWEMLSVFFRESLKLFGLPNIVTATRAICVTAPKLNPNLASAIRQALRAIGFADDQFLMEDTAESFYYYGYSQQPQIWARSMGLLEFSGTKVRLSFLEENRKKNPPVARLNYQAELHLPKNDDDKDLVLAHFIKKQCGTRQISAIFITGNGFSQKWAKMSVHALAECGQRVFEGDNLFVKGACYAAAEKKEFHRMKGRVYEGDDLVRDGLSIDVIDKGALGVMPLLVPGRNWYENGASLDFILDGRKDIVLTKTGPDGHTRENIRLPLEGLPERPNRTTRIHLTAECLSEKICHIRAEDLGFGEFFPATHKVWETEFKLSEPQTAEEEPAAEEEKSAAEEEKPKEEEKKLTAQEDAAAEQQLSGTSETHVEKPDPDGKTKEVKSAPDEKRNETVSVHKARHFIVPEIPREEPVNRKKDTDFAHVNEEEPEKTVSLIPDVPLMATIKRSEEHRKAERRGDYSQDAVTAADKLSGASDTSIEKAEDKPEDRKKSFWETPGPNTMTPEEKRHQEDLKRLDEMSGTGGATPEERKSTLDRLLHLQIPSIQPENGESSEGQKASDAGKITAADGSSDTEDNTRLDDRQKKKKKKRAPYSMRFGIDFDADIPEEDEIDTGIKGGDDQ